MELELGLTWNLLGSKAHACFSPPRYPTRWPLDGHGHSRLGSASPWAALSFPRQQPAPASEPGGKGGNGVPKSDLYNLLAALVKGVGAKGLKLMTTVSFMY